MAGHGESSSIFSFSNMHMATRLVRPLINRGDTKNIENPRVINAYSGFSSWHHKCSQERMLLERDEDKKGTFHEAVSIISFYLGVFQAGTPCFGFRWTHTCPKACTEIDIKQVLFGPGTPQLILILGLRKEGLRPIALSSSSCGAPVF